MALLPDLQSLGYVLEFFVFSAALTRSSSGCRDAGGLDRLAGDKRCELIGTALIGGAPDAFLITGLGS
jgi:hypothetical protein